VGRCAAVVALAATRGAYAADMTTDTSPVHLTVAQAAQHARVSTKTIRRWIASGRLTTGRAGLDTVRRFAEALEVKPADLMGQPPEA
jgi:excisionase family DNA binding protein